MAVSGTWRFAFDPSPAQIRAARQAVVDLLIELGWDGPDLERAKLIVSELATNVVRHAGTPFEIVCMIADELHLEVRDRAPATLPELRSPASDVPNGRGLKIVSQLAHQWGVQADGDGKVVWCRVRPQGEPQQGSNGPVFA